MAIHITFDHDPDPGIALVVSTVQFNGSPTDAEIRDLAERILASDMVQDNGWTGVPAISSLSVDDFRVVPLS